MKRTSGFLRKRYRTLPGRGQHGQVLIELLISIAIFGVISVGFLSALVTGYRGVIVAHDVTMAESLTRTALEAVRDMAFSEVPIGSEEVTTTRNYDVGVLAEYVSQDTYLPQSDPSGILMITVTVKHHDSQRIIKVTSETKVKA